MESMEMSQLILFIDICCHLRASLALQDHITPDDGPLSLPSNVILFLIKCLETCGPSQTHSTIKSAWEALGSFVWQLPERQVPPSVTKLFLRFGESLSIGELVLFNYHLSYSLLGLVAICPPETECPNNLCPKRGHRLRPATPYRATLFTIKHGPIPVFPVSSYCSGMFSFDFLARSNVFLWI